MSNINFEVITLFPKVFESLNNMGVISRAIKKDLIKINLHDLRDSGEGAYRQVDDTPYGGGSGMVLKPGPIYKSYELIQKAQKTFTLLMTPQGQLIKQKDFARWTSFEQIIIICGQYEGFDERVRSLADEEVSIGDYILTGGEIPAITIINGITRLLPGAIGDPNSLMDESHNSNYLEYPQYTRPEIFKGLKVPSVLLSGNHKKIKSWRANQMLKRTFERRADLMKKGEITFSGEFAMETKNFKNIESEYYPDW